MCGFFLINQIELNDDQRSIIKRGLDFRGPDYQSQFVEYAGWTLYHTRLSIIGLDNKYNQPFITDSGALLFNGEIFNYEELGFKYFDKKYDSDTALLYDLIAYQKLNFNELDGFFAFCFVHPDGALAYAARDKFGVKPLFHYNRSELQAFSSEPAVLNKIFELGFSDDALEEYYCCRYPIFIGSYFDQLKSVEAGSCVVNGKYFSPRIRLHEKEKLSVDLTLEAVRRGIQSRLVADAPVALLLSKGVDSNLIRNVSGINHFYSVGFTGDEDTNYLRTRSDIEVEIEICTPEIYKETFKYLREIRGEPLSVPNEVLLYIIATRAKADGFKVLLSGEGADEFFGGYDRIYSWAAKNIDNFNLSEFLELYCYQIPSADSSVIKRFKSYFDDLTDFNTFEKVRLFFIEKHLPVLFRRLDFALMAAGVEGREPLANSWVYEYAVRLSHRDLISHDVGKVPLRELLARYEGNDFAYEKKVGFPVPINKIFAEQKKASDYETWFSLNLEI